jgi:hypothetical protein
MKILFIGDIVGRIGRQTVCKLLPKIRREEKIDFCIANAENAAHGSGITEDILKELNNSGVDCITLGDHAFKNRKGLDIFQRHDLLRPANFPPGVPGEGWKIIEKNGWRIMVINLIGRTFMDGDYDCPFRILDEILANYNLRNLRNFAIIIDMHAEATSEKACLFHYADGRVNAVFGTHTHVQTADAHISRKNTAFISDVGMVGFKNGSLGLEADGLIKTFLTQIKEKHVIPEKGEAILNAVILEFGGRDNSIKSIKPLSLTTIIK